MKALPRFAVLAVICVTLLLAVRQYSPTYAATTSTYKITQRQLGYIMLGYPDPSDMTHPKYFLNPGLLVAEFRVTDNNVPHNALLSTAPQIVNGKLVFHITSYTWAGKPVPAEEMQEFVATMPALNQYLDQQLLAVFGPTYKVQRVTITAGLMTVVATV